MVDPAHVVERQRSQRLRPAGELLGAQHPLAAAARQARHAGLRLAALAVFVAGAVAIGLAGGHAVKTVVIAALVLTPILVSAAAGAVAGCRLQARDVIIAGLEDVPARELRATRRRLARPRHRHDLATVLRQLAEDDALREPSAGEQEPVDVAALLDTVADDLDALDDPRVRGIAACEQLIHDGVLVRLAGSDREGLRRELRRLHFLLVAR
jgi:hypothetical protein